MKLPRHLGIIMDGNGRWATARGLDRSRGHREGLEAARRVIRASSEAGIPFLTLFAFSTENWKRSVREVGFLMGLVARHLENELGFYRSLGLRVVHSGDRTALPANVLRALDRVGEETAGHAGMVVNLAINHGGRDEILRACERARSADPGRLLDEEGLRSFLDLPFLPDLDLVIRTGGEMRLSNFFLWRAAYAELVFSDRLWPDFDEADLEEALREFAGRDRRYGGAGAVERSGLAGTGLRQPRAVGAKAG